MTVAVIGGGPAGCFAAIAAAENGAKVTLFEKNEKIGKKLYITGKGRCNLTNASDVNSIISNTISNPKFLKSALYGFTAEDAVSFFNQNGLKTKTERGGRIFPESDKSSDVIKVLHKKLDDLGVKILFNKKIDTILKPENKFNIDGTLFDAAVIATGGISYPSTGSSGDGYKFAKVFGHTVIKPLAGLSGIVLAENVKTLAGLTLKNVRASVLNGDKTVASEFGEMLFTHSGVSGPIILTLSSKINRLLDCGAKLRLSLDLKPALSEETLNARLLREFEEHKNKDMKNLIPNLVPSALCQALLKNAKIDAESKVNAVTKAERIALLKALKGLVFEIRGIEDLDNAIITCGGVRVSEINPKTMESKLVKGLYFAGEVLDVDAETGGFNLQIAYSTGYAAGKAASMIN